MRSLWLAVFVSVSHFGGVLRGKNLSIVQLQLLSACSGSGCDDFEVPDVPNELSAVSFDRPMMYTSIFYNATDKAKYEAVQCDDDVVPEPPGTSISSRVSGHGLNDGFTSSCPSVQKTLMPTSLKNIQKQTREIVNNINLVQSIGYSECL
jgi:hypothetical protein